MGRRVSLFALVVAALTACVLAAWPAQAAKKRAGGQDIERRIDSLLRRMTLEEKLNQLTLLSDGQMKENPAEARKPVGAVFSETDPVLIDKYQHDAVENSRLHIPILFAFDTIHGFRTIFPIPLGDRQQLRPGRRAGRPPHRRLRVGGGRAQADLQPDGRRLARAALGPHLRGRGRGPVPQLRDGRRAREGRAGQRLRRARQGRHERQALRRLRPARGGPRLQHDRHVAPAAVELLPAAVQGRGRRRLGHADVLVQRDQRRARAARTATPRPTSSSSAGASTASSRATTPRSPSCAPARARTRPAARAATASPRTARRPRAWRSTPAPTPRWSRPTTATSASSSSRAAQVSMRRIDDAVRRILRVKFRAGLFEHPYVNVAAAPGKQLLPQNRAAARRAAGRSMVLLKNDGPVLPLDPSKTTAIIGPLGDSAHDMLGPWWGRGDDDDAVSLFAGMKAQNPNTTFTPGLHDQPQRALRPRQRVRLDAGFPAAVAAAPGRRPGRAGARRDARDERRGRGALDARPARQAGGADRRRSRRPASRSRSCCSTGAR